MLGMFFCIQFFLSFRLYSSCATNMHWPDRRNGDLLITPFFCLSSMTSIGLSLPCAFSESREGGVEAATDFSISLSGPCWLWQSLTTASLKVANYKPLLCKDSHKGCWLGRKAQLLYPLGRAYWVDKGQKHSSGLSYTVIMYIVRWRVNTVELSEWTGIWLGAWISWTKHWLQASSCISWIGVCVRACVCTCLCVRTCIQSLRDYILQTMHL